MFYLFFASILLPHWVRHPTFIGLSSIWHHFLWSSNPGQSCANKNRVWLNHTLGVGKLSQIRWWISPMSHKWFPLGAPHVAQTKHTHRQTVWRVWRIRGNSHPVDWQRAQWGFHVPATAEENLCVAIWQHGLHLDQSKLQSPFSVKPWATLMLKQKLHVAC